MSLLIKLVPFPETWKKITYCHLILKWTCIVYTLCTSISFKWTWISSALGGTSAKLGQRTTPNQQFIAGLHNLGVYSEKTGNLCTELIQV